jgi:upstream activation factor subunit UAF30
LVDKSTSRRKFNHGNCEKSCEEGCKEGPRKEGSGEEGRSEEGPGQEGGGEEGPGEEGCTGQKAKAPAKKRTPNAAFMKALTPSPQLAAVVGSAPLPRTEVVSKLWAYIKKNKLQDAVNKRMVNADAKLKEIFGKAQVSMFEMAGLIGKHVK